MNVGRLRHRLRLQRRSDTRNESGETLVAYSDVAEVWGSVRNLGGRELFAAQQVQSEVTTEIIIRWRPGVDSTARIIQQSTTGGSEVAKYDVVHALQDDHTGKDYIKMLCVRRVADGVRSGESTD